MTDYLLDRDYEIPVIKKAIFDLKTIVVNFNDSLCTTNKNVFEKLCYGIKLKAEAGDNFQTVHLIDWDNFTNNSFYIAEEVTIKEEKTKRPDIVFYINGVSLAVIELNRSTVKNNDGIRQNISNQQDVFIQPFFATIPYLWEMILCWNRSQPIHESIILLDSLIDFY